MSSSFSPTDIPVTNVKLPVLGRIPSTERNKRDVVNSAIELFF